MENEIKEMLGLILNKIGGIESRLDGLESRQDEIYLIVKAIEHNNEVHRAEINSLQYRVHYIEGTFNAIGDVIATRKAIK